MPHPVSSGTRLRVCILSSGGDAPALNAVIRAFVHASRQLGFDVLGCRYGFEGLVDPAPFEPLTIETVRGILPRGGSMLGCSTRLYPFARSGASGEDFSARILARLARERIDALVLAGGDGTLRAAQRFHDAGMPCVTIAKTIDNDLGGTEVSCGFDTAVQTATNAIDALHSTAESHQRVMVLELMGRYAGWIALTAGIAGGADVVLIPEIPYRIERVVAKIRERESLGLRFSIVVVGEGARPVGGEFAEIEPGSATRLPRLGGAGERLVDALRKCDLGHEVRLTVLGHLQRGGSPTAFDRALGSRMGVHAAELVARRAFGRMVVLQSGRIDSVSFADAVERTHRIDPRDPWVTVARALGIELGDEAPVTKAR